MKFYSILFLIFLGYGLCFSQDKEDTSSVDTDGPYLFYHTDKVVSKQIKNNKIIATEFPLLEKTNRPKDARVVCYVSPTDSFVVPIKNWLKPQEYEYPIPKKLIAISDIEGNFKQFKKFLIHNKVMDKNYQWTFGKGHLVLNGDFFDRGLQVTQCLWLIYKLEQEAENAGGKVHFILGNHDIMNMYGSVKYVRKAYFENANRIGLEYEDLYAPNTELGKWLQSKNIVQKIGKYLFVHAGISPELNELELSLKDINELPRPHYFNVFTSRKNADKTLEILLSSKLSPYWYRGIAKKEIDEEDLEEILEDFKVSKMVIGHTLSDEVSYLYNGTIINIDTDHAKGKTQGLLIQNNEEYKIDINGKKSKIKHL